MEHSKIHCQVCSQAPTAQRLFLCQQCARVRLYEFRIRHAQVLLEKETLAKDVENNLSHQISGKRDYLQARSSQQLGQPASSLHILVAQIQESKNTCEELIRARSDIAQEILDLKETASERRRALRQSEAALSRKKEAISARGLRTFDPLPGITRKVETDWARLYNAISEDRVLLCSEVANLYGLEVRRRTRDSKTRDVFYLGDVPVVDLRELNNAVPALVTVSLERIAHLLHLTSHYLSLQLPAEITLPSASNPHTLIHTPLSSYKEPSLPAGQKIAANTVKTSRQRVLYLDKPLTTLAAEDQVAYSFFIDAVTLLAWNIAWLAKTQGIEIGAKHWDEICNMGRNLWLLFGPTAARATPVHARNVTNDVQSHQPLAPSPMARTPSGGGGGSGGTPKRTASTAAPPLGPGRLSHASGFAFQPAVGALGGSAETFRTWTLANPIRLIERIKGALAHERMGAEWEVLEEAEWAGHTADAGSSGTATPRTVPESVSSAARMRGLLLGRTASTDGATVAAEGTSEGERSERTQSQRRGWL